jgi:hypothetical protein
MADPKFLEFRFRRRLKWAEAEDGKAVVLRPRFGESRAGRWLESLLGLSPYRIRLDEIGTLVWKNCDGKLTAGDIAGQLRSEFGDKVEPAEDRLQHFIAQMNRARMIEIRPSSQIPKKKSATCNV